MAKIQPRFLMIHLIGDHVDYCGFSVLPSAIERDVLIAMAVIPTKADSNTIKIKFANVNESKYPSSEFEYSAGQGRWNDEVPIDKDKHEWGNYLKVVLNLPSMLSFA